MSLDKMILIPCGTAYVGSDTVSESPKVLVDIPAFRISKHQVTNSQFRAFIESGGYDKADFWSKDGFAWLKESKQMQPAFWDESRYTGDNQPVTGISFYEAEAYAKWANGRLPTEVEWEKAARGTQGITYPWGQDEPTLAIANFSPDYVPIEIASVDVDKFPKNVSPFGCYQMAGNLYEWCSDYFHTDTPQKRNMDFYREERVSRRRVLKGGAWTTDASRLRAAARWSYTPDLRDNIIGFRIAQDVRS
ncbi:SUMF1/EgtB/PvdO family nonheme iron enzyme [Photobacterium sp. OFAV2-7]|uniref:formylglycine-generating enzyme family protein n=1 Tax=Photobacterium sp. OFAV2-7 TaxID=2917748 RepID=UPI001EF43088|nr:SUMF1/EgtB/PvdO family nonheme iron enzyme [Photobacterium sp. OFAV2-7]MCG7585296.1 formylglycine-generating enzyme family protein [Photobacterium sp. OFAV2-7]